MRTIESEIDIAAPPARVWDVLTDLPRHAEWNPFITSISGLLRAGEKLHIRISPPGRRAMAFSPRVLVLEPQRELRWKGKLGVEGLFDGEHYFRLTPTATGTRFEHGETFTGLLVPLLGDMFEPTERGFNAMNQALRRRAES